MYAVIRAGGKQFKVTKGDVIEVERLKDASEEVEFTPLLVVDDAGKARAGRSELAAASVTARVVGEAKGKKVDVYRFRSKTGYRRHTGHRQSYTTIEISDIRVGKKASGRGSKTAKGASDGS